MSNASRPAAAMTPDAFLDWAEAQPERHEFDGTRAVAMVGGTVNHIRIARNILIALTARLRGTACEAFGADAGILTVNSAIRYPDALVTCTRQSGSARLIADPVIVFQVLSPTSGATDRIIKLREYAAVARIRRHVILEFTSPSATVLARPSAADPWTATALTAEDILALPEISKDIPMAACYLDVEFITPP
jgi:Uma2 family endonuclease